MLALTRVAERGGMIVVRMVLRKLTASSLTGSMVTRQTPSIISGDAPLLRAYARRLASNSAVVNARVPRYPSAGCRNASRAIRSAIVGEYPTSFSSSNRPREIR